MATLFASKKALLKSKIFVIEEPSPSSTSFSPSPLRRLRPSPLTVAPLHLRPSPLPASPSLPTRRCRRSFVVAPSSTLHPPSPITPVESALTVASHSCFLCGHHCRALTIVFSMLRIVISLRSPSSRSFEESYEALRVFEILAVREKPDVRTTTCAKERMWDLAKTIPSFP
ncbi:hypothetical protein Ahy_A09g044400 [Arachis hypogaea]|uniref:Uncharacterized protein n=1 Tax=Arachis hypogaea TaxID=3818 RepID=A0A445BK07_ARAHY|nr:hypothetical protein Ahy_A09g044400 [Arachis hypogaea]